jgi:hypothetical protein
VDVKPDIATQLRTIVDIPRTEGGQPSYLGFVGVVGCLAVDL